MLDDLTQKIVIHLKDLHKNLDDLENGNIAKGLDETTLDELFEKVHNSFDLGFIVFSIFCCVVWCISS